MKICGRHFLLLILIITLGCQGNPIKSFAKISKGMDKSQVLDIMGSPQRTQRWQGRDRWTYLIYEDEKPRTKELVFEGGKVVYAGGPIKSGLSAEQQDKKNEAANKQIEKILDQKRAEYKKLYPGGAPKPDTTSAPTPASEASGK